MYGIFQGQYVPLNYLLPHIVEARLNLRGIDIFAPCLFSLAAGLLVLRRRRLRLRVRHGVAREKSGRIGKKELPQIRSVKVAGHEIPAGRESR